MPRKKAPVPKNRNELPASPKRKPATKKKVVVPEVKKAKVEKPFADGTMSSAMFFGMLRSALRRKSMYWPSIQKARKAAQIPYTGTSKRMKYLYVCSDCKGAYPSTQCAVHHQVEVGSLQCFEDLPGFVERLFCSSDLLLVLCDECHDKRHPKKKE